MIATGLKRMCALAAAGVLALAPAAAQDGSPPAERQPMIFGAASNFSQGFRPAVFEAAQQLPLRHYRDGMRWSNVERRQGQYRFRGVRQDYPARLEDIGAELVLTVNWGNPLYDGGYTPHTPEGLAAFGRYVAALVERFPAITAIEVGNEINGANFVNGPVLDAGRAERGRYHLAMVRAAREAATSVRPDIRILGGSTHSLPAGFLWPILDEGAHLLDGLALHPYTTRIDQLGKQIGVLQRHPAAPDLPISITEWGSASREKAPDDMLRGYAMFAALGVESLYWYPLNDRGDGLVPLVESDGSISRAGQSFRLIQNELGGELAEDISPDEFTRAIRFGPKRMVLWGALRDITITRSDIEVLDARGTLLRREGLELSPERPVLLRADRPLTLGRDVQLGCSTLMADSFYQFSYGAPPPGTRRWQTYILYNGKRVPFTLMPGQHRGGVPWNPYLGYPQRQALRLDADSMQPLRRGEDVYAIVHSFTAPQDMTLFLEFEMNAPETNGGPAIVTFDMPDPPYGGEITLGAVELGQNFSLAAGEEIKIVVRPQAGHRTAPASYRFRLHDLWTCPVPVR